MSQSRILGIGYASVDYIGVVSRLSPNIQKQELLEFSMQGGGSMANALSLLAKWNIPSCFAGKLGNDQFGDFIRLGLQQIGVHLEGLVLQKGKISPFAFVTLERATANRSVLWTRGDVEPLEAEEVDESWLDGVKLLYCDGHHPEAAQRLITLAKERNIQVVLDADIGDEQQVHLARQADILIVSERFAAEATGKGVPQQAVRELREWGAKWAVIMLGKTGSLGLNDESSHPLFQPIIPLPVVDTTGAGDVYHGAFLYALLEGWELECCMALATAAAGLHCRALGARAGLPGLKESLFTMNEVPPSITVSDDRRLRAPQEETPVP